MIVIIIIAYVVQYGRRITQKKNNQNNQPKYEWEQETPTQIETKTENNKYINGYQPKWLLSYNEKAAYKTIKQITDEKGYTVFTKVRLLDLVEPRESNRKDQSYLWKIQAKHLDFVICDKNLVAKWVIELQDNSHKKSDRIERDNLVKAILTSCNYKILMTYTATKEEINTFLSQPPKIRAGEDLSGLPANDN